MKRRLARLITCFGFCAFALGTASVALAGVIFTNFGPGHSYDVNSGNVVGNGFDGSFYQEGSSFTPTATATFGSIVIALSEVFGGSQVNPITISLRSDAGNSPGAILESFLIAPGSLGLLGNNNAPITLMSLLNLMLAAGTEYWITATLPITSAVAWNWNSTGDLNAQAINQDGTGWFSPSGLTPGAFEVDSPVSMPEPATLVLLALGFAGLGFSRRRK